jgi:hypothetical protein
MDTKSITNRIRSSSSDRHEGRTETWIIHVRVKWAYLAYPIGMLLMGISYVLRTILESTRLKVPVWKESALPMLSHGFVDVTQARLRERNGAQKVKADNIRIRFAYDGEKKCMRLVAE